MQSRILLLCFILGLQTIQAQAPDQFPGYCITTSGDSISGTVYIGEIWKGTIRIQKNGQTDWLRFQPQDIRRVVQSNGMAIYAEQLIQGKDTQQLFVQQFLSGGYNLYEGRLKSLNPVFYLNSRDKPNLMRINPFAVETQLKVYFGNCADKTTVKPLYEKERLSRYVKAMNACAYPETAVAGNKTKIKPTLSWAINAGVNQHMDIEAGSISGELLRNEAGTFSAQPKFTSGLNLYFNITPAISIFTGAHYIQKAAVADSSSRFSDRAYSIINPNTGEPFTLYARYFYKFQNKFQVHYLECPIAFRFRSSPLSSNGFQALGGITLSFPISKFKANGWGLPYKVEAPVGINPTPTLEDGRSNDRLLTAEQPQIGFFLGTGWHWKLDKRNQVSALLQFHWGKETISTGVSGGVEGQIDFETKRFQLGLAWEFSGKPQ